MFTNDFLFYLWLQSIEILFLSMEFRWSVFKHFKGFLLFTIWENKRFTLIYLQNVLRRWENLLDGKWLAESHFPIVKFKQFQFHWIEVKQLSSHQNSCKIIIPYSIIISQMLWKLLYQNNHLLNMTRKNLWLKKYPTRW